MRVYCRFIFFRGKEEVNENNEKASRELYHGGISGAELVPLFAGAGDEGERGKHSRELDCCCRR